MKPISICVIFKNEEKHLDKFLRSIKAHRELCLFELILADTGSTDNSVSIAQQYDCTLINYKWNDDFADARNYVASKAHNDWILFLDCDEFVIENDFSYFDSVMKSPVATGTITRNNYFTGQNEPGCYREKIVRLYNKRHYHYKGIIHEQLCTFNDSYDFPRYDTGLSVNHEGYIGTEEAIKGKAERNINLLEKALADTPNDPYIYFQLGQAYHSLGDEESSFNYYDKGLSFDVDEKLQYVNMMVIAYGYSMLNTGRYSQALSFTGIYETFCTTADFVCLMGLIYLRNGLYEKAIYEFEKAVTIPTYYSEGSASYISYYNLGVIYEVLGEKNKAQEYYDLCGSFTPALKRKSHL